MYFSGAESIILGNISDASPRRHVGDFKAFLADAHAGHKRDRGNIKFNGVCSQLQTLSLKLGMLGARQLG